MDCCGRESEEAIVPNVFAMESASFLDKPNCDKAVSLNASMDAALLPNSVSTRFMFCSNIAAASIEEAPNSFTGLVALVMVFPS